MDHNSADWDKAAVETDSIMSTLSRRACNGRFDAFEALPGLWINANMKRDQVLRLVHHTITRGLRYRAA
jgi:hypothetical protein